MTTALRALFASMLILSLLCCAAAPAVAQNASRAEGEADRPSQDRRTLVQTYNVSDLLRGAGDRPVRAEPGAFDPAIGGMFGEGMPAAAGPSPSEHRLDAMIELIQQLVDSNSWRDNGGEEGQIKVFGQQLVIEQTEENHQRIASLLQDIRKEEGPARMVAVQAYWIELDDDELKLIRDAARKDQAKAAPAALPAVADDLLQPDRTYWRARTACFSGQTVHLVSGRVQNYLADITPIVATNSVGYDPGMQDVQSGVSLQITPQLIPNTAAAVVDLQSLIHELESPVEPITFRTAVSPAETQPVIGSDGGAIVERVRTITQQLATTVRVPLGRPVLIGGMTMPSLGADAGPRQIYLVLEVTSGE